MLARRNRVVSILYSGIDCMLPRLIFEPLQKVSPGILLLLLPLFIGCGNGKPAGCPEDLSIPDKMNILGASYETKLFVLRLRTTEYRMPEVVPLFRDSMKNNGWDIQVDSATDENGGEIKFMKGDERRCTIFMSHTSDKNDGNKAINIDIKCDRETTD